MKSQRNVKENVLTNCIGDYLSETVSLKEEVNDNKSFVEGIKKFCRWNEEEDELLKRQVNLYGDKDWKKISQSFINRTSLQCLHRWTKILKPGLIKGPWTIEEDRKLLKWVEKEGPQKWTQCSDYLTGRTGKQCRERWFNSLNPKLKKGSWTTEEDFIIFNRFSEYGSKWSKIAAELPGRTENSIKNRFYSTLRSYATEQKNLNKSSLNNPLEKDEVVSSLSLSSLLNYFQMALDEKTINYKKFKANVVEAKKPLKNNFLSFKTSRPSESISPTIINKTTNINNTFNINLSISSKQKNNEKTINTDDVQYLGIPEVKNAIENWNGEDIIIKDYNLNNLENKINKVLNGKNFSTVNNNFSYNNDENKVCQKDINKAQVDPISNLISHLDDLEKVLHKARDELKNNRADRDLNINNKSNDIPHFHNDDVMNFLGLELKRNLNDMSPNLLISDADIFNISIDTPLDSFSDVYFYGTCINNSVPDLTNVLFN